MLTGNFLLVGQEADESVLPPIIPLSSEHVSNDGIYLLENGEDALIYFGSSVDSSILQQLFGFTSVDEVSTQVFCFKSLDRKSTRLNSSHRP